MFAEMPACLCLGHEAIDFKDSTSKKHPWSASKEHVASTADRMARQVQELHYAALHLYEFQDIPKDVAQARSTVLAERGGWKFLDLLCDLQHQLNVDITVVIRPLAEDVTCNDEEIRVAMLTLHRMDWLSTTYVRDPAANRRQTRRAVIDDQIAVFREQTTESQSLAIMIFEYIMDILSQLFGIQGKAQDFIHQYCAHRKARPTADSKMIDQHGITNFVKYVLVTHCIDLVFSMGVLSSLEMLQSKNINPARKLGKRVSCTWNAIS